MPRLTKSVVTIELDESNEDISHTSNIIEDAVRELRTHIETNGHPGVVVTINSELEHDI